MRLIAIALLCIPFMAAAQTTEEILHSIEHNNIELQLARTQGAKAVLQTRAENSLPATEVEYSPFFTRGIGGMLSSELVVSQSFDMPWLYAQRSKAARMETNANSLQADALRQDILLRAKTLCIEVGGLNETLDVVRRRECIADSLLSLYYASLQRGGANILDVNRIRLERMAVQTERMEAEAALAKAIAALTALNGGKPIDVYSLTLPTAECTQQPVPAEDLRIAAATAAVETARQRKSLARSESLPTLTLGYRRNTDASLSSHGVLVGAAIPLFGDQKRRAIARAQHDEAQLQARQTAVEVQREYAELQAELQQAADIIRANDTQVVHATLMLLGKSFAAGQLSLPEYLSQTAPLYEQLQRTIAMRTLYQQTLATLLRSEL